VDERKNTFLHALAFVIGFTAVFTLLGASVGLIGYVMYQYLPILQVIGGTLLVILGLATIGVFAWTIKTVERQPWLRGSMVGRILLSVLTFFQLLLYTERRPQIKRDPRLGYLSSALMGVFFSAGWVPCVGPILAAILLLASDAATVGQGAVLLAVYSAGLGIPFLLTGAAFSTATGLLRRLNQHANIVSWLSGLFLILVGFLLATDQLRQLTAFATGSFGTGLISLESSLAGEAIGTGAVTFPLALIAGLLSFFSPCVLPLIPAYIGYLSGAAVYGEATSAATVQSRSA